uniref:DUF4116 domain-containing protein n=1 Tax=viral metagenome TaxID=1070528 RepID=A0A6C0ADA2_9ZZZZ
MLKYLTRLNFVSFCDEKKDLNGAILNGKDFKKIYGNIFCKVTNKNENHYGFQYKDGLNTETLKPNSRKGGLYFTDCHNISEYSNFGIFIRKICIPDESVIFIDGDKYVTDKMILGKKTLFEDSDIWNDVELCKLAIEKDADNFKYIKNQTEELCLLAISKSPKTLKYVKNKTYKIYKAFIEKSPWNISDVPEEYITEELLKISISYNALMLQNISEKFLTEDLCLFALKKDVYAFKYIPKNLLNDKICLIVIEKDDEYNMIQYVPEKLRTEKICKIAVKKNGSALQYVPEDLRTMEMCLMAIQENTENMKYVPDKFKKINFENIYFNKLF